MTSLAKSIELILRDSKTLLATAQDGGREIGSGAAFGSLTNDIELQADRVLGEYILERLGAIPDIGTVTVEGLGDRSVRPAGLWATVDPLDGSLNYKTRGRTLGLPYASCITVLAKKEGATFNDIIAAGVIDLRSGDAWLAEKQGDRHVTTVNNHPAVPVGAQALDLGKMIVIGEFYYPENREKLARAFSGMKGWLRNPGSAAYEMALVASGQAAAYVCDRQKQHELGAAYALVKGAGGSATDWDGRDLGERPYLFSAQTPVLLCAKPLANDVLALLRKAGV